MISLIAGQCSWWRRRGSSVGVVRNSEPYDSTVLVLCWVASSVLKLNVLRSFELCVAACCVRSNIQFDFRIGGWCWVRICRIVDGMSMGL